MIIISFAARIQEKNGHLHDYILEAALNLLRRDVSEYGRHLVQYFGFFLNYASLGDQQKLHLIKVLYFLPCRCIHSELTLRIIFIQLDVPTTFIQVSLDDGPAPPIKYQSADLGKLYQLVSVLIRSCDVSHRCRNSQVSTLYNCEEFYTWTPLVMVMHFSVQFCFVERADANPAKPLHGELYFGAAMRVAAVYM